MSTLNNITTQLDGIKTDVVTCHSNLKTNLVAKGVEVLPSDKMSTLIDKVREIEVESHNYPNWYTGSDLWISAENMPASLYSLGGATIDRYIHIINGHKSDGSGVNSHYRYDTIENTWDIRATMPTLKRNSSICSVGNYIYSIGGAGFKSNLRYDTIENTWEEKTGLPANLEQAMCISIGTNIYLIGGYSSAKTVYCYDTISDTWSTKEPMSIGMTYSGISSVGTNIYVMGGMNSSRGTTDNLCYDTISDTWSTKEPVPTSTDGPRCASLGTNIYIIWGPYNYCYDTVSNTWSSKQGMTSINTISRRNGVCCIVKGVIYYIAGMQYSNANGSNRNDCYVI